MTVVFGKEVTCIGDHLFTGCLRLKDIYIEAPIPPAVADGFNPSILSEVILHVPSCSRVIYAERFPWSDFVSNSDVLSQSIDSCASIRSRSFPEILVVIFPL